MPLTQHHKFMMMAIALSESNVVNNLGGPFGAVIVKNGKLVAKSANTVVPSNDPTAHAEIAAIRLACTSLNTFDLTGCTIYTSCEPCPMCLGAIYWAKLDKMFYANSKKDAAKAGFDDDFIYQELDLLPQNRKLQSEQIMQPEANMAFEMWVISRNKINY